MAFKLRRACTIPATALLLVASLAEAAPPTEPKIIAPQPVPVVRPSRAPTSAAAETERLARLATVKSWGYQLNGATVEQLAASPFDLLVIDATTGLAHGRHIRPEEVAALKRKPDGSRRIVLSYLSIGEAEDYRPEYFAKEYLEEEAPDWLMHENKDWKGNRLIKFCAEGWQRTILGDDEGRSVYSGLTPSPLYRLIELGFDGVYLDRVDVYEEITKQCPAGERRMVDFVVRLAVHARKSDPRFLVVQQNAEALLKHPRLVQAIDAVAKESLFFGWGGGDGANIAKVASAASVKWSVELFEIARRAGRTILTVDYAADRAQAATAVRRSRDLGYVPYVAPKALDVLWLPGKNP